MKLNISAFLLLILLLFVKSIYASNISVLPSALKDREKIDIRKTKIVGNWREGRKRGKVGLYIRDTSGTETPSSEDYLIWLQNVPSTHNKKYKIINITPIRELDIWKAVFRSSQKKGKYVFINLSGFHSHYPERTHLRLKITGIGKYKISQIPERLDTSKLNNPEIRKVRIIFNHIQKSIKYNRYNIQRKNIRKEEFILYTDQTGKVRKYTAYNNLDHYYDSNGVLRFVYAKGIFFPANTIGEVRYYYGANGKLIIRMTRKISGPALEPSTYDDDIVLHPLEHFKKL